MTTLLLPVLALAVAANPEPQRLEWKIDGVMREAIAYAPTKFAPGPQPLVFVFHGHGSTMQNAAQGFAIQNHWPEAFVVYMQGLPTPTSVDPDGKRSGWQIEPGVQRDRDVRFFDAVLDSLRKEFTIDPMRIYVTGMSNGGRFTYVLWAMRPDVFAAYAPVAGPMTIGSHTLKPAPVMIVTGEADRLVKIDGQRQQIERLKKLDGCTDAGKPWATGCEKFASKTGTPVVSMIHAGGHVVPKDAPELIVRFFKEQARK
jgi:polyhydroxybutyrate depolymerase